MAWKQIKNFYKTNKGGLDGHPFSLITYTIFYASLDVASANVITNKMALKTATTT